MTIINESYLCTQANSNLPNPRIRFPRDYSKSEIVFPLLENSELFETPDIFQLININKVLKSKFDVSQYLKGDYAAYLLAESKYKEYLPKHNNELLTLFEKNNNNVNFDAIVYPSSSSEWLREGLVNCFQQHYKIDAFEAKKSDQSIKASACDGQLPHDFYFYFEDESIKDKENIIVLDDCYTTGSTVKHIVKALGFDKRYAIGYFIKFMNRQETQKGKHGRKDW